MVDFLGWGFGLCGWAVACVFHIVKDIFYVCCYYLLMFVLWSGFPLFGVCLNKDAFCYFGLGVVW